MRYVFTLITSLALTANMVTVAQAQSPAQAPTTNWQICNQTSYVLRIANAYMREGRVQAAGWQTLHSGACLSESTPQDSPRYLYAESLPIHNGDIREWAGSVKLCADTSDFQSDAASNCEMQDLLTRQYLAVNPVEFRTDLIEPGEFGDKAETAGIQRLLKDAGYKISRIDGVAGRRTSQTIKSFKKDKSLDSGISNTNLINALIDAAQDNKASIGLEICNESSARIWSAIATRHQGGWQSRGWWDIEPNACAKPYNAPLKGTETHIYALQENVDAAGMALPDRHLRTISAVPSQFCIAEAKFSALGREFCTESGYNIANFRPVTTENNGTKISLTDVDFTEVNSAGLRR